MARVKLTEHKAKSLLYDSLEYPYSGVSVKSGEKIPPLSSKKTYVVKVDQGIKKRMKRGLVKLGIRNDKLQMTTQDLGKKGYDQYIIEEMLPHESNEEKYIAIERTREGMLFTYSKKGGIDIEENADKIKRVILSDSEGSRRDSSASPQNDIKTVAKELRIEVEILKRLREFCDKYYVSFLEINPLVVLNHPLRRNVGDPSLIRRGINQKKNLLLDKEEYPQGEEVHILDLAVEVDSTAQFFVKNGWGEDDVVSEKHKSPEEISVATLNKKSQAALSLTLLNPNGAIWVLLSGGGASITIADEVHNLGFGKELGNYGEYSGNPNAEETYLYTCQILSLMLKSNKRRLILIIGGGVANFTDIRITFKGIIRALEKFKNKLKKKNIKIFVRRGGPYEKEGLEAMEEWLKRNKMYGLVAGPNLPLNEIVREAIKELKK